jgi:CRISPR-associated protein Cmr4
MIMNAKLMLIQALSPLHAGTGQGVGVIDQPIAREKATNIPYLPGSSLKGVFRDACEDIQLRTSIYGPDTGNADLHAGAVSFTDARLLLLPVRSLRGVFGWVTSPLLLRRFVRDAQVVQGQSLPDTIPTPSDDMACLVDNETSVITMPQNGGKQVILEDLPLSASGDENVSLWSKELGGMLFKEDPAWQEILKQRLCVVSDDVLGYLIETATEITARIRLHEEKKTVERGALWYEEALPTESVLASLVVTTNSEDVFGTILPLTEKTLQFGGNATTGRGLCKAHLV